jgi:gamma-glutamyltranspeptidase
MKAVSRYGTICTPHRLASEAGVEILRDGGNAIDAILTAAAALSVCYPHMTGIGGDALLMVNDGKQLKVIMGLGQSGQSLPDTGRITTRGPASAATTAGALRAWHLAKQVSDQQWSSKLKWPTLLKPAIDLAQQGTPVSKSQAFWQHQRRDMLLDLPDMQRLCNDSDGNQLPEGHRIVQPQLADTMEQLAHAGIEDFYHGEVAEALAKGFDRLGNGLTRSDLENTRATLTDPLKIRYRNGYLYNFPPPTQGLYTLSALSALGQMPLSDIRNGSADYYHYLVEAIKAQLVLRNKELADPSQHPLPLQQRLSVNAAVGRLLAISPDKAGPWHETGRPADTIWMSASDNQGRTVCLMQSLFHDFGSGCFVGDTGVLWSNRAASFHSDPEHPNCWAPGKIPAHTLNPSCHIGDDGQQWYFGSQGGDGQPQTQMVLATQLIDYQQTIEAALSAPRFLLGRSFFGGSESLKLEKSIPSSVARTLAARGHLTEWVPELSPLTGQAGVLHIHADGLKETMHDPRGEGIALGLGSNPNT